MKILAEGKAHRRDVMYPTCNFCESKLRIIYGDPRSKREWSGHNEKEYMLRFKCPVCKQISELWTFHDHSKDQFRLEKDEFLTIEDKKEIEDWDEDPLFDLDDDDLYILDAWDTAHRVRERLGLEEEEHSI